MSTALVTLPSTDPPPPPNRSHSKCCHFQARARVSVRDANTTWKSVGVSSQFHAFRFRLVYQLLGPAEIRRAAVAPTGCGGGVSSRLTNQKSKQKLDKSAVSGGSSANLLNNQQHRSCSVGTNESRCEEAILLRILAGATAQTKKQTNKEANKHAARQQKSDDFKESQAPACKIHEFILRNETQQV